MPDLQIINGSLKWKIVHMRGPRFVIGRKEGCHLIMRDAWVSREHALLLETAPGSYEVQDLDSENGTFVNNQRIREAPIRDGDVLRVGRTEMRFTRLVGAGPDVEGAAASRLDAGETPMQKTSVQATPERAASVSTEAAVEDAVVTTLSEDGERSAGRNDLRERVRRLEKQLQEREQDAARLATENLVLKRALVQAGHLQGASAPLEAPAAVGAGPVPPDLQMSLVANPAARMFFPDGQGGVEEKVAEAAPVPGARRLAFIGAGFTGTRFAEAFARLGHRNVVAIDTDPAAMGATEIPPSRRVLVPLRDPAVASVTAAEEASRASMPALRELFRRALPGMADHYFLLAGAGGLAGGGSLLPLCHALLDDLAARGLRDGERRVGGLALLPSPEADLPQEVRERAIGLLDRLRTLVETGRLSPLLFIDAARGLSAIGRGTGSESGDGLAALADTVAGALDLMDRLPCLVPRAGAFRPGDLDSALRAGGVGTFGLATAGSGAGGSSRSDGSGVSDENLAGAASRALSGGRLFAGGPASGARAAILVGIVGGGLVARDPSLPERAHGVLARAAGGLPQARSATAVYEDDGRSVRVVALLTGEPFPADLLRNR